MLTLKNKGFRDLRQNSTKAVNTAADKKNAGSTDAKWQLRKLHRRMRSAGAKEGLFENAAKSCL